MEYGLITAFSAESDQAKPNSDPVFRMDLFCAGFGLFYINFRYYFKEAFR